MSVQTAPLSEQPTATPSLTSLLAAVVALVGAVTLLWALGSSSGNGNTLVQTDAGAAGASASATPAKPTAAQARLVRLNTPVGHHGEYRVQYADLPPRTQAQLDVVRRII